MASRPPIRFPLMAVGMVALVTGMWAGLVRLGWNWPVPRPAFLLAHGPLMVSGFVGTLIGIERAVALGPRWTFAAPALTACGTLALIVGFPAWVAPLLMTAGSMALMAVYAAIIWNQLALFTITMGLGAVAWFMGNGLWLAGRPIFSVASWWLGFLVLTIAGERLELSRLLQVSRASQVAFVAAITLLLAGLTLDGVATGAGARLTGLGLIALTLWLARHDIARRTVRQAGLTRFTAVCLLSGYVWLGVGGALALWFGAVIAGPQYDAVLHAVLLGFVFAMIFGHAPIIFPAVLGLPVPFRTAFYAHLTLLHFSIVLRLLGDLAALPAPREWGGLLNAAAVLLFLANTARSVLQGRRTAARQATESQTAARTRIP
jgi:hypothetical protein